MPSLLRSRGESSPASNRVTLSSSSCAPSPYFGENGITLTFYFFGLGTRNRVQGNAIFANAGLGIDLLPAGVTPNDDGDGDSGPNYLQNFPVLTSASSGGSSTRVEGTLNSTASTDFTVEFFANSACDPSGYGEGETPHKSWPMTQNSKPLGSHHAKSQRARFLTSRVASR